MAATYKPYGFDLLDRRHGKFVLWRPGAPPNLPAPVLIIGTAAVDSPTTFVPLPRQPLSQSPDDPSLWELKADNLQPPLQDGTVYRYWFEIQDTSPEHLGKLTVTDPFAFTVDYRLLQEGGDPERKQPASVIKYQNGKLWPCDNDGVVPARAAVPVAAELAKNDQLVIYELPTSWTKAVKDGSGIAADRGTFSDVQALFDEAHPGDRFASVAALGVGQSILEDLGIRALELLPIADAKGTDEWGYATAHYFAPDYDLGTGSQLLSLTKTLQKSGVRLFLDTVMAFGHDPYRYIDFPAFHIRPGDEPNNPDSKQSGNNGDNKREGYGGESWRYINSLQGYDPKTGRQGSITPARTFHIAHLTRWMNDFGVDGFRLDSVNNVGSWDFVREYRQAAWDIYQSRTGSNDPSKFIVLGEELSMPGGIIAGSSRDKVLDAMWNEPWQGRARSVILGRAADDGDFEKTVRRMVDCRQDGVGFTDGAQSIIYLTSHDVESWGDTETSETYNKGRLCNYLWKNGVQDAGRRAKLGFACLLTSVGIPMIFAGEEFCDIHDLPIVSKKQVDPVNYDRLQDPWRRSVFDYVANLVRFRSSCPALGVNDTSFIHVDYSRNARVLAWTRGGATEAPVVVVANFSDEDTPGSEYYVENWPDRGRGDWREVTQNRDVPREWVGREPLMHWEIKIYTYWRP